MSEPAPPAIVTPLGAGRFLVARDGRQRLAHAVRVAGATWVFLDGEVTLVSRGSAAKTGAARVDVATSLSAPMPATVIDIAVENGQRVAAGDVLVRLEAMKMELPIRSPRDATVIAIKCRQGELVQPGVPLLELDDA